MSVLKDDEKQQSRLCDFCGESVALLYCRADVAKLCLSCDREVHSTNQLFTKHTRFLLCDACDSSPASIYCSTDASVHCQNCDWERHNISLSTFHDRRPLEGFTGCPSVTELLAIVGFEDLDKKALFDCDGLNGSGDYGSLDAIDGLSDLLVWDTPSFVSLDDLISSSVAGHNFQVMGVPPPPKNRNATCGQHKEEILRQLRALAKLEPNFDHGQGDIDAAIGFQQNVPGRNLQSSFKPELGPTLAASHEVNAFQWCSDSGEIAVQSYPSTNLGFELNHVVPDKDSDIGDNSSHANIDPGGESYHPFITSETLKSLPKAGSRELTNQDRDSAISRYKEKKKNRRRSAEFESHYLPLSCAGAWRLIMAWILNHYYDRYEKHIRYESRRVRAESRMRIKGRFAKIDEKKTGLC